MKFEIKPTGKRFLLFFISVSLTAVVILFFFDSWLRTTLQNWLAPEYFYIAKLITRKGLYLFYAVFAAVFIYALVRKNEKLKDFCLSYLKAQLIFAFALVRFLKVVLGRVRPEHGSEFTFFSFHYRYNSFPSGHAADAFISGVFLYYLLKNSEYPGTRFLPLIYAFLIAISRVFVNVHHPSDVAAGMTIGILGAWVFTGRLKDQKDPPD